MTPEKQNFESVHKGAERMNITLMAHDKKKELMVQFCTAYKSIL